jgi:hypothetical protein
MGAAFQKLDWSSGTAEDSKTGYKKARPREIIAGAKSL